MLIANIPYSDKKFYLHSFFFSFIVVYYFLQSGAHQRFQDVGRFWSFTFFVQLRFSSMVPR